MQSVLEDAVSLDLALWPVFFCLALSPALDPDTPDTAYCSSRDLQTVSTIIYYEQDSLLAYIRPPFAVKSLESGIVGCS